MTESPLIEKQAGVYSRKIYIDVFKIADNRPFYVYMNKLK